MPISSLERNPRLPTAFSPPSPHLGLPETEVQKGLVSVVVPCFNRAHYLRATIDSILKQDYPHIECIVMDGGSKDGTVELLRSYGGRIRWVSEPDEGQGDAINKGWRLARGDILAWLNADDIWKTPDAVSQAVAYFDAHPEVDVVYGICGGIDAAGNDVGNSYYHEWNLEYAVEHCDHCIPQPAAFIQRRILERVGVVDTSYYHKMDHELWLRIGLRGTIHHIPTILAYGRFHEGNKEHQGDKIARACVQITRRFFSSSDVPSNLRRLRTRAISNAYLRGVDYSWYQGRHWGTMFAFAARGIATDPSNSGQILHRLGSYLITSMRH